MKDLKMLLPILLIPCQTALAGRPGYLYGRPAGQEACYTVDHDQNRTMSVVKAGGGLVRIRPFEKSNQRELIYPVDLEFQFSVLFYGLKQGVIPLSFPPEYFTQGFLPRLAQDKRYTSPLMTMDHLGFADVTTVDGVTYPNARHLLVYNFDLKRREQIADAMAPLIAAAIAEEADTDDPLHLPIVSDFKELKADVYVLPGVPAVGVIKLDMTGEALGVKFRVGLDYTTDPERCANLRAAHT